ncbi:Xaa-Pro aminopeptidase [Paraglaciecola aquimarina]|uniref:Xaa-Pro aminopeptidase n=1 Tax=Paraglaciecola algarum TaxID=3050085 RepID=A0ABS9D649_9ALTE|nr:Xaa-Pro aminopeptidase [Paraglaciecola sp. G1-23]MCF2948393.1 Xaa-Pro aminopeptidase [Paraglaciecola sp. G1-23]
MSKTEFKNRRNQLLQSMQANSICLISAAELVTRSRDTEFSFRQDSYFQYLCGFPEPQAWLVLSNKAPAASKEQAAGKEQAASKEQADKKALSKHTDDSSGLSVLFCLDKDPTAEIWQGRRFGPDKASQEFGLDLAFGLEQLEEKLVELVDGHQNLYFAQGHNAAADEFVANLMQALREAPKQSMLAPTSIIDVRIILDEMRLIKSDAELDIMRQAADISGQGHKRAMQFCQADKNEYHLEAEIHHEFAMLGAKHPAYGTIVGGGDNACILHYTENNQPLKAGDLVLIDAGCELQGYAADITRTFPVSGKFNPVQAQLYQIVLDAQLAAFEWVKPGNTIKQATDVAVEIITQGLIDLGILQGQLAENIEQQTYRQYFMHGLGHWLGLDVHDVGTYKIDGQDRPLKPGMVLTIEPGIYIAPDADVDPKWQGIGIRIEDNLVVTEKGYENLTQSTPKTIGEIEGLMQQTSTAKQSRQSHASV